MFDTLGMGGIFVTAAVFMGLTVILVKISVVMFAKTTGRTA